MRETPIEIDHGLVNALAVVSATMNHSRPEFSGVRSQALARWLLNVAAEHRLSAGETVMLLRKLAAEPLLVGGDRVLLLDTTDEASADLLGCTLEVEGMDPDAPECVLLVTPKIATNPGGCHVVPGESRRVRVRFTQVELESPRWPA